MNKAYQKLLLFLSSVFLLSSCDTMLQGMAAAMGGYGGYGMGGYQVYPGGFVRNTSMDYLLNPNIAIQQVQSQEQQEYQAAKKYRPNLTLDQFRAEKGQAIQMSKEQAKKSSSSSASQSSSSSTTSSSTYQLSCTFCHGGGKCNTCNGKGWYLNELDMSKKVTCPNCKNHNGICVHCNGTGKVTKHTR